MERITGTITDGNRPLIQDLTILMLPAGSSGDTRWRGELDWPRDATPPHPQRFYQLQTADGRSGQIVFVGPAPTANLEPTRVRFRTSGPFD